MQKAPPKYTESIQEKPLASRRRKIKKNMKARNVLSPWQPSSDIVLKKKILKFLYCPFTFFKTPIISLPRNHLPHNILLTSTKKTLSSKQKYLPLNEA